MAKLNIIYSPNFNPVKRKKKDIQFIILHYTGMKKELAAIKKLCDKKSKVSSHFFIKKNGEIIRFIPDLFQAWHAGKSKWHKKKSLNKFSIGIEIHNRGHDNKYEKFSSKQIISIQNLLKKIIKKYKIKPENVLGHSDIAPQRKKDPGEKFPWKQLAKVNLAKWHKLNDNDCKKLRLKKLNKKEEMFFLRNIYTIGYNKIENLKSQMNKKFLYTAFQRRFRQDLINGKSDQECLAISKSLLKY